MITRNIFIIGWLAAGVAVVLLVNGYLVLNPIMFLIGLSVAVLIASWKSMRIDTKALIVFVVVALVVAIIDEFAHTSAGVFSYHDEYTPSFLTVLGWPIFLLTIAALAEFIHKNRLVQDSKLDQKWLRMIVPLIPIVLIPILVFLQGYQENFDLLLIGVYCVLALISFIYVSSRPVTWSLSTMLLAALIGGAMEVIGAIEGMWEYATGEHLVYFMALTWVLRTWAVVGLTSFLKVTFTESKSRWMVWLRKNPLEELNP